MEHMTNLPLGTSDYDKRAPWNKEVIGTCKECGLGFDAEAWAADVCEDCSLDFRINNYYVEW